MTTIIEVMTLIYDIIGRPRWLLLDGQEFVMTTDHVGRHIQWHVAKAPCDDSYDLEFLAGRAVS